MEIKYVKDDAQLSGKIKEVQEKLDELLAPKEYSDKYTAMMNKYRKSLNKLNKEGNHCPWEWSFGLDYLVEFLRFMRDYYALGENVWAQEDCEWVKGVKYTRLQTLTKTLEYYDKWQNVENEYIQVVYHPETYAEHDNEDGTTTVDDLGFHCVYKYGTAKRTRKKIRKVQDKYKKLFFKNLYKYIETWWD